MPFSRAPRVLKGAFVQLDRPSGQPRVITFQYNPEKLLRKIDEARQSGGRASPAGPPREVITCTLEFDASDALEHPDEHPDVAEHGLYPVLSALELLMRPHSSSRWRSWWQRLFGGGPDPGPLTLFSWGPERAVPVRLARLIINEELHSPDLNPIRATVEVTMQVLREKDLPRGHWGRDAVARHITTLRALALRALAGSAPVDLDLGNP